MIRLPTPPERYDRRVEEDRNQVLERADAEYLRRNRPIIAPRNAPVVLVDEDGVQWQLVVATDGTLSTAAFP